MPMSGAILVCVLSVTALCVNGQSLSASENNDTSFTRALTSASVKPRSTSATPILPTTVSIEFNSLQASSPGVTLNSSEETPVSSTIPSASGAVIITPSPALSVSSTSPSVSSPYIRPSSMFQPANSTIQTAQIPIENESRMFTAVETQTASILTTVPSIVTDVYPASSVRNTLSSKLSNVSSSLDVHFNTSIPLGNATIPYTASTDSVSPTLNNSVGIISSSIHSDTIVTNVSGTQITATNAYSVTSTLLESSTFVTKTLGSQTPELAIDEPFTTSDLAPTIVLSSSSHIISLNESTTFNSATDLITATITTSNFTDSVYELANMTYTPFLTVSMESVLDSSIPADTDAIITSQIPSLLDTVQTTNETLGIVSTSAFTDESIVETQVITQLLPTDTAASYEEQSVTGPDFSSVSQAVVTAASTSLKLASDQPSIKSSTMIDLRATSELRSSFQTLTTTALTSLLETMVSSELSPVSSELSPVSSESYATVTQGSPAASFPSALTSSPNMTLNATNPETTTMVLFPVERSTTRFSTATENSTKSNRFLKHVTYRVMITFDGKCDELRENELLREEFWKTSIDVIRRKTKLQLESLEAENMLCDPLRIYLRMSYFYNTTDARTDHVLESLKNQISSPCFNVPIIDGMQVLNFTATKVDILDVISDDPEVARTRLEVVDVVIISIASFLFAVLVFMMIIVLCRECYVRKRTTTFHLAEIPHVNLKLSDFTLTRIPRPRMFYRENSLRKPEPVPLSKMRKSQNGHSSISSNAKVNVNADNINVRMRDHEGGLVVGITYSDPPSPNNDTSSSSSSPKSGDQSKRSLLKGEKNGDPDGVTNPNYSADEEVQGNTKIVIQDDENEQFL